MAPKPTMSTQGSGMMHRRGFIGGMAAGSAVFAASGSASGASAARARVSVAQAAVQHELPKLPYADDALSPVISANTIGFHYGKHHATYVNTLNNLLKSAPDLASLSLEEVVKATAGKSDKQAIFNNAAQAWNHAFYWHSMRPGGGGQPRGRIKDMIDADLGGWDKFKTDFQANAVGQFGSGWGWLIVEDGKLKLARTGNAETPMAQGKKCLLTIDVWEHAYYLDWQNRRADHVTAWLDKLANWEFAEKNLG